MSTDKSFVDKKYKLIAPDGGWGYAIWVTTILVNVSVAVIFPCFGMIFNDFMIELNMGSATVALLTGVNGVTSSLSGYAAGPMMKFLSARKVALIGAIMAFAGSMGIFWCNSIGMFFFSQGLQSTGAGFLFTVAQTILNEYFVLRRLLAIGVTQSLCAVLGMVAPLVVEWSLKRFGYRGTVMLIAGVWMQNFIAAVLIQPVQWHMKRVPVETDEEAKLLVSSTVDVEKTEDKENGVVIKIKVKDTEPAPNKNKETAAGRATESPKAEVKPSMTSRIADALDLSIFRDVSILSASLGIAIAIFSDVTFGLWLPQSLYAMKWSSDSVAWTLTLLASGDLAGRLALMVFSGQLVKVGPRWIYMAGLLIALVTRTVMLGTSNNMLIMVVITITGVSRCTIQTLIPVLLAEVVEPSRFASTLGMCLMMFGAFSLLFGPVIGAVRDLTDSYDAAFYILNCGFAIVLLFWSIEMCCKRNQNNEQIKLQRLESRSTNKLRC